MPHTFDRQILKVPANLILWATRFECLDQVAMFLLFKRVHRSGHFHSMKVPADLGISRPTFHKYFKIFLDNGWAHKWGKGFRLLSIYDIQKQIYQVDSCYCFGKFITLKNYKNKYSLITQLRWIVLHHKYDQIKYAQTCKELSINYSERRKLPKSLKKLVMATHIKVQMSVNQIGKSFRRSKTTGQRIKKELRSMRMLQSYTQKPKIIATNVSVEQWYQFSHNHWNRDYSFSRTDTFTNGIIFENRPDIIYLENPVAPIALNNTVPLFFTQEKFLAHGKTKER